MRKSRKRARRIKRTDQKLVAQLTTGTLFMMYGGPKTSPLAGAVQLMLGFLAEVKQRSGSPPSAGYASD